MQNPEIPEESEFRCNVYVASLPLDFDDVQLSNLFAPYGRINSARIMRTKKTRLSKGYGFVLYKNASSAELAVASLMGHVVGGNRIQVRIAHPDASFTYNGQRGLKGNNANPGSFPLPMSPPPMISLIPQAAFQAVLSPAMDPSMIMTSYALPTPFTTLYPPIMSPVVGPATKSDLATLMPPQIMLLPQYAPQVQRALP